jgi:hypothetical protein
MSNCYPLSHIDDSETKESESEFSEFQIERYELGLIQFMMFESLTAFTTIEGIIQLIEPNKQYIIRFIQECQQASYRRYQNQLKYQITFPLVSLYSFFYFPKCFDQHTKFVNLTFK